MTSPTVEQERGREETDTQTHAHAIGQFLVIKKKSIFGLNMSKHRTKQRPTQTELILSLSLSLSTKFDVSWVISALFFMILWLNVSRNLPV